MFTMKGLQMSSNSRREFFKNFLGLAGAVFLAPALLSSTAKAEQKRRPKPGAGGGGDELADPTKDMAKTLGYKHKSDQPGKECKNCQLFTAAGKKGSDDVGKCAVIPGKLVKASGYCNSWSKKA
jgi:hypothetical protein